jgi:N-acetylglucosamine kinase-like BadF-type ATPase
MLGTFRSSVLVVAVDGEGVVLDRLALGVDGGNSKTEVLIVDAHGVHLGTARGAGSSPHAMGLHQSLEVIGGLIAQARANSGLGDEVIISHAAVCVAGVDLPVEEQQFLVAARDRAWASNITVRNDTFALLRAGSPTGWGVAMVLGAGTNCVAVARDGRVEGYLSLGSHTGDVGGGYDLGRLALHHAARAEDGRGRHSLLCSSIADHFGVATVLEVAIALHQRRIAEARLVELPPLVFAAAEQGDAVALELLAAQADEVVTMVGTLIRRLDLDHEDLPVVLGGGMLAGHDAALLPLVRAGVLALAPGAEIIVTPTRPVVGAAMLALDALRAAM